MELTTILERIEKQNLILPDFQRGFVWEQERMRKLYASVLAKIPIGSILTLESPDEKFNCKQIGAKPRTRILPKPSKTVDYLIDGQQRITSLLAGFSTYYFENFYKTESDIASNDLLSLYFLKIPAIDNSESDDIFGARELKFKKRSFSSSEMYSIIDSKYLFEISNKYTNKQKSFDILSKDVFDEIYNYCTSPNADESGNNFYRIPLQLINGDQDLISKTRAAILDQIANHHKGEKDDIDKTVWTGAITNYFTECLTKIGLEEIKVENSDKARAIDIYNNLNQGGVKLSILDLIIATVGTEQEKNFYDQILDAINMDFHYDKSVLPTEMQTLIQNQTYYKPFDIANIMTSKGEMKKMFTNVFLDVLALLINKKAGKKFSSKAVKDGSSNNFFTAAVTKENEILKLSAKDVIDNYIPACQSIERALFFFQTRCGIREFDLINYKAQITVIAYFFSDDNLFNNKKVHDLFEYWYWISVFAWMYPNNQKIEILNSIEYFEKFIEEKKSIYNFTYLYGYRKDKDGKNHVLNVNFYSNQNTLTLVNAKDTEKYPPKAMTYYICQFYLSRGYGYKSFFIDTKHHKTDKDDINVFYDERLEIHHINPLGADPNKKLGQSTKELREDPSNPYNSPLNMMYINKNDNGIILDMDYAKYSQDSNIKEILPNLDCIIAEPTINSFLTKRYDGLFSKVKNTLDGLEMSLNQGV